VSVDDKVFYQTFWCLLMRVSTQQTYGYGDGHGVGRRNYAAVIFSGYVSKKKYNLGPSRLHGTIPSLVFMVSEPRRPISHYTKIVPARYVRKLCIQHVTNVNSQNTVPYFTNIGYLFNVLVKLLCAFSCTNDLSAATSLRKKKNAYLWRQLFTN
jgi:hypothetical protein